MNLIANGCSFTSGVPLNEDEDFTVNNIKIGDFHCVGWGSSIAWPYQIEGVTPYNISNGGSGNPRIVRTTIALLDMVPQEFIDDSIFVIQWSSVFRKEYWCDNNCQWDVHGKTLNEARIVKPMSVYEPYDPILDDSFETDMRTKRPEVIQSWIDHKFLGTNLYQNVYESLLLMTVLTKALQDKNARFLYTSMSWENIDVFDCPYPDEWNPTAYHKALYNLLPKENTIKSVSQCLDEEERKINGNGYTYYIPDDGHPNDKGNKLFANYVKEELEKRNWLT